MSAPQAVAGILNPHKGLLGNGEDWNSLATEFASFAASQDKNWTSPEVVGQKPFQEKLQQWLQEKIKQIKLTNNLQLDKVLLHPVLSLSHRCCGACKVLESGQRNPLMADPGAVDPCWRTTVLYQAGDLKAKPSEV